MKTKFLLLSFLVAVSFLFLQCSKDSPNQLALLPPVSTTGANTFGCLVDGTALLPRDGLASVDAPYPHKGIEPVFGYDKMLLNLNFYNARDNYNARNNTPLPFFLDIHLFDSIGLHVGEYNWQQTSYGGGNVDDFINHVYGSLYDNDTKNYEWFGSYDNSGITIISMVDTTNHIISGTFSGKLRIRDGGTKEVTISDGRFDINWATVYEKEFP